MTKKITVHFGKALIIAFFGTSITYAQEPVVTQGAKASQEELAQFSSAATALSAYSKWREENLINYVQGLLTPHYAVSIIARRLDDNSAQVEILVAADMKHYVIKVQPVTLSRSASGETTATPSGRAVTLDLKAGEKLGTGPDKIRLGQTTTVVPVSRAVQALEITWTPKNDKPDDPTNSCIVQLRKEATVMVNGYIAGAPVR